MCKHGGRLCVCSFALALGITWGLSVLLLGFAGMLFGWGAPVLTLLASAYLGYAATFVGSLLGALWAFVDGFIGGLIFAWLYNLIGRCCGGSKCCEKKDE